MYVRLFPLNCINASYFMLSFNKRFLIGLGLINEFSILVRRDSVNMEWFKNLTEILYLCIKYQLTDLTFDDRHWFIRSMYWLRPIPNSLKPVKNGNVLRLGVETLFLASNLNFWCYHVTKSVIWSRYWVLYKKKNN